MFATVSLRRMFASLVVASGLALSGGAAAEAHDYYGRYAAVSTYVTVMKPTVRWVTRYDDCGHSYRVKAVSYRPVRVRVTEHALLGY